MTSIGGNQYQGLKTKRLQASNPLVMTNYGTTAVSDNVDVGYYSAYNNGSAVVYSGIYRIASTGRWTFANSTTEPNFTTGAVTVSSLANLAAAGANFTTLTVNTTSTLTGNATFAGQIYSADGSVSSPGYSFSTESNSGIFKPAAGRIAFSATGTSVLDMNTTRILLPSAGIYAPNTGTTGGNSPAYAFANSITTGMRYTGSNLVFSTGGTDAQTLTTTATIFNLKLLATAAGSVSAPDIGFNAGSLNTGFYYSSGPRINVTVGGVLQAYFDGTDSFTTTSISTGIITNTGAITVSQPFSMGSNGITTTGTISTGTLTSSGTLQITAATTDFNSNSITGVNSLSLTTLTAPSIISVSQNMNMGAFTLTVSSISTASNSLVIDSLNGTVSVGNIKEKTSIKTGAYTLTAADGITQFDISGSATCTLPLASSVIGLTFTVILNGSGTLTITCSGSDDFHGVPSITSIVISRSNSSITLTPSVGGTYWLIK